MYNYRHNESNAVALGRATRRRCWVRNAVIKTVLDSVNLDASSPALAPLHSTTYIDVHYFENQRRSVFFPFDWGSNNFENERAAFSDETGNFPAPFSKLQDARAPEGFEWDDTPGAGEWKIDRQYIKNDESGWSYGIVFANIMEDLKNKKESISPNFMSVRRRRWIRRARSISKRPDDKSLKANDKKKYKEISKIDIFKDDKDSIMRICKERKTVSSPIVIPWNQIIAVDVITPSIVSIEFEVNRYFGQREIPAGFEDIYNKVSVNLFIRSCPAEALCALIQERMLLCGIRSTIRRLVSSGSMTGDSKLLDSTSTELKNGLNFAEDLSLGSEVIMKLDKEALNLKMQVRSLEEAMLIKGAHSWFIFELKVVQKCLFRLKVYTATLLGVGLMGPSFEEEEIKNHLLEDVRRANKILNHHRNDANSAVDAAKDAVSYLLDVAEMRIRDMCLCGWSHQGGVLERCLHITINQYYIQIVELLGQFFDSKEGLESVKVSMNLCKYLNYSYHDIKI